MSLDFLSIASLVFLLVASSVSDLHRHRIPNLITFGGIALAFLLQYVNSGADGALLALSGLVAGFVLFVVPYALSAMGAGDVKLMMMVGAFLGWHATLEATIFTLIVGGVMALLVIAVRGGLAPLVQRYAAMLAATAAGQPTYIAPPEGDAARTRFPYALAIALGTGVAVYRAHLG